MNSKLSKNGIFDIPILFLVFNRLDTTKQVFEAIRKAAPQKLYIASDGPRSNRNGEDEKVKIVREYVIKSIDWECEVKTLFREENLGCGRAVSSAITWFFENEEMGIILEDDCLPSESFFPYCKELLEMYKDDARIYCIGGCNILTEMKNSYSYCFSRLSYNWGWASWKRAWEHFNFDIINLNNFIEQKKINRIFKRYCDRYYWLSVFKKMETHEVDTWDYQWTYTIFNNNGITIFPAKNQITNIGFGTGATHTTNDTSLFNNQKRFEITELIHPNEIKINDSIMNETMRIAFGLNWLWYLKINVKIFIKKMRALCFSN
jgi:hypothetical protein